MEKDQVIHDLAIVRVHQLGEALTPDEQMELYYESYKIFETAHKKRFPPKKAKVLKRGPLGL